MSWNTVILVASLAAVVVFAVWAVRLHAAGDPVWKVAVATVLLALSSALLRLGGQRMATATLAFIATMVGAGLLFSFTRGRARGEAWNVPTSCAANHGGAACRVEGD